MKRALACIASVGILAVTVGMETANAQPYRRYGPARTYAPQPYPPQAYPTQSRGSVPRGVTRTVRLRLTCYYCSRDEYIEGQFFESHQGTN